MEAVSVPNENTRRQFRWADVVENNESPPRTTVVQCASERRSWSKFGDAVDEDVSAGITRVSAKEVLLERPKAHGSPSESFTSIPSTSEATTNTGAIRRAYVPPSVRAGADRRDYVDTRQRHENSLRITNLSEDAREADLVELFGTIGPVTRAYVAIDQATGKSRCFGFVNFVHHEDAERAVNQLNGYGYDNLILCVDWAAPRT